MTTTSRTGIDCRPAPSAGLGGAARIGFGFLATDLALLFLVDVGRAP